jgi:hypothetical protein
LANWVKKEDPAICSLQDTHVINRNKQWLRVKAWRKIYQANGHCKQAIVTIHISDKVDFKFTLIKRDKGHFILIEGEIHKKEITIINLYAPTVSAHNVIKHTLKDLKAHTDSNTVVVGDFNSPITHRYVIQTNKLIKKLHLFYFIFFYSFIHMCIHCLGHFSPLPPVPTPSTQPPHHFQPEPVLPLSLILLKRRHKHSKKDKAFLLFELR